jgi:hypothetical protein
VNHAVTVAHGRQTYSRRGQILRLDEQADRQRERRDVPELPERVNLVPRPAPTDQQAILVLFKDLPRLFVLIVVGREHFEAAGSQQPGQHLLQEVAAQWSFAY